MDAFEKRLSELSLREPSPEFGQRRTLAKYTLSRLPVRSRSRYGRQFLEAVALHKKAALCGLASALLTSMLVIPLVMGGSSAFAQVIERIRSAKTMSFKLVVRQGNHGEVESESHVYCMVPGKVRIEHAGVNGEKSFMVYDQREDKTLFADQTRRTAALVSLERQGKKGRPSRDPAIHMIDQLRTLTNQAAKHLGSTTFDGVRVVIVAIEEENRHTQIWANEQSGAPLKIEVLEKSADGRLATQVLTQIELNLPLEADLFSVAPPPGFAVSDPEPDRVDTTRAHQVASFLQIYTRHMNNKLPSALLEAAPELSKHLRSGKVQQPPFAEMMQLAYYSAGVHAATRGQRGHDWQYRPDAVLGERDAVVFWFLDGRTGSYWVVYGDLRVAEVAQAPMPTPQ